MTAVRVDAPAVQPLPGVPPSLLGESPVWLADGGGMLWWCDIPGRQIECWSATTRAHRRWALPDEPGCIAPVPGGTWLVPMRDGLWHFDPATGSRTALAEPPYDPTRERFNDGKCDAPGHLWVSTIYEPRDAAKAALYRWADGRLDRVAGDATVGNGLGFSPDGRTVYWADTWSHRIDAFDVESGSGRLSNRRLFAGFPRKPADGDLSQYGGRPDGAAVDAEGCLWVAMFEGSRLLRLSPRGEVLRELRLPVRCPTMPCFGGADLRTLFVTTSREKRPPEELHQQPLAGCVLMLAVDVPGLPVHYVRP
ncbi:MAG: SMP-30/gluconolactonase/LRE family protein [Rubrivivax sp.]|nr:SMP-30/gluconolactonase/LRE family protein [Rubrivivax sp.]